MTILVVGARGILGRRVASLLVARGYDVRAAGRTGEGVHVDLSDGTGLPEALAGVEAVFHCATDPRHHRRVDLEGTRRLLDATKAPVVYPGIVGCDVIPLGYYRSKLAAEELVLSHSTDSLVMRATQFHQLIWASLEVLARSPLMVVPHDTRFQVLDPTTLAHRLVEAFECDVGGRLEDVGGPSAYGSKELARSFLAATGRRRPVVALNAPGLTGAAFRAGGNLTPHRDEQGETWNDFVRRAMDRTG